MRLYFSLTFNTTRITAHKIRLYPTPEQEGYLRRAAGSRRFIYNWGLDHWQQQYAAYQAEQTAVPAGERTLKPPTAMALKKQFNAIREQDYSWTYEVTKCVVEGAFFDLRDAFSNYFAGRAEYPKFKKKGKSHESFYIANDKLTVGDHWVQIPVLGDFLLIQREATDTQKEAIKNRHAYKRKLGKVRMAEKLRFRVEGSVPTPAQKRRNARKNVWCETVRILGATVSLTAGKWYISIQVEITQEQPEAVAGVLGVDVGIKEAAVVSDKRRFENQRPLTTHLRQLKRLHRKLSKKQYDAENKTGSRNREKVKQKLARLHAEIAEQRLDAQHKLTTAIARSCRVVGVEDLHVKGMLKNPKLARAMADAALGQLLRLLETKMATVGGRAIIVGRFFPSTKRCSGCGHIKKRMPLKYRTYICLKCGLHIDRDLNAAINLAQEAMRLLAFGA